VNLLAETSAEHPARFPEDERVLAWRATQKPG